MKINFLIFLLVEKFTNTDRMPPYLIYISNYFQTLEVLEKKNLRYE